MQIIRSAYYAIRWIHAFTHSCYISLARSNFFSMDMIHKKGPLTSVYSHQENFPGTFFVRFPMDGPIMWNAIHAPLVKCHKQMDKLCVKCLRCLTTKARVRLLILVVRCIYTNLMEFPWNPLECCSECGCYNGGLPFQVVEFVSMIVVGDRYQHQLTSQLTLVRRRLGVQFTERGARGSDFT